MSTLPGDRSKQKPRSRIVVNVEEAAAKPAAPRGRGAAPQRKTHGPRFRGARWYLPIGVFALVLLAFLGGTYFWWQAFKAKPAYALALVLDAARRDDVPAFDALVNVDEVSRSLAPQVAAQMRAPGAVQMPAQVRRQIEANAVILLPGAREQVRATLMEQIKQVLVQSGTADDTFLLLALGVARVVEIKPGIDGQEPDVTATATLNVNGRPVELGLRANNANVAATAQPVDTRWRVVGVKSDELATRIAETLVRVYPAGK